MTGIHKTPIQYTTTLLPLQSTQSPLPICKNGDLHNLPASPLMKDTPMESANPSRNRKFVDPASYCRALEGAFRHLMSFLVTLSLEATDKGCLSIASTYGITFFRCYTEGIYRCIVDEESCPFAPSRHGAKMPGLGEYSISMSQPRKYRKNMIWLMPMTQIQSGGNTLWPLTTSGCKTFVHPKDCRDGLPCHWFHCPTTVSSFLFRECHAH